MKGQSHRGGGDEETSLRALVLKLGNYSNHYLVDAFTGMLLSDIERLQSERSKGERYDGGILDHRTSRHLSLLLRAVGVMASSPAFTNAVLLQQYTSTSYFFHQYQPAIDDNKSLLYLIILTHRLFRDMHVLLRGYHQFVYEALVSLCRCAPGEMMSALKHLSTVILQRQDDDGHRGPMMESLNDITNNLRSPHGPHHIFDQQAARGAYYSKAIPSQPPR